MRLITIEICDAFERGNTLEISNSRTDGTSLWLFENKIAEWRDGNLWISNGGWNSKTTKERLNGISSVSITQRAGQWFLNGHEWHGQWTRVIGFGADSIPEAITEQEVDFDTTLEWIEFGGYNRPIYAVVHTNTEADLFSFEMVLNAEEIPYRIIETDTAGEYKPNYFIVIQPQDIELAKSVLNNQLN